MRTTNYFIIFFIFLLISGCKGKDEKMQNDIIGKYYYSKNEKIDEYTTLKTTGTINLKASGRVIENATYLFEINEKSIGNVYLKYKILLVGNYYIRNSYLVFNYEVNNIILEPITINELDKTEQELHKIYDPILNEQFLPELKKELLNNSETKLTNINGNTLILENQNGLYDYFKKIE